MNTGLSRGRFELWPLARDRRGTTAVEFALVSLLFFGMVLFTCEVGFYLYAQISLDYATSYAARQMLTGNGRTAGLSAQSFQSPTGVLCKSLSALLDCSNIYVNLQPLASGQDYKSVMPASNFLTPNGTFNQAAQTFDPGQNASVMVMQVFYLAPNFLWPLFYANGQRIPIVAAAAYINET